MLHYSLLNAHGLPCTCVCTLDLDTHIKSENSVYYCKRSRANDACNSLLIAVGNVINVETGDWTGKMSGLGAGLDSFYEYLLKVRI